MASALTDLPVHRFRGADGLDLAYRETGEGRPVVLIHGLFSNAWTNWIRYGHAARIGAAGFRVIMPDLRAHGSSAAPHDRAAYPSDILAADGEALIAHLGLTDYDLGGYSLGARTALRMMVHGVRPRRAIVAGMGLGGMIDTGRRSSHFRQILQGLGTHARGSPEWMAEAFLKTTGGDAQALLPLLDSFVDTPKETLAALEIPMLVLSGVEDHDNGSAAALAGIIPHARYCAMPGGHMTAVLKPELGSEIVTFLTG